MRRPKPAEESRARAWVLGLSGLNPEPFAFESGFPVRWLIEAPRSDGLLRLAGDVVQDCTHPSTPGETKVADGVGRLHAPDGGLHRNGQRPRRERDRGVHDVSAVIH